MQWTQTVPTEDGYYFTYEVSESGGCYPDGISIMLRNSWSADPLMDAEWYYMGGDATSTSYQLEPGLWFWGPIEIPASNKEW